jgi:hypothetical protein
MRMQNDPVVERLARERLGWAKPGEMVVDFSHVESFNR